jgi:hypothetical protein
MGKIDVDAVRDNLRSVELDTSQIPFVKSAAREAIALIDAMLNAIEHACDRAEPSGPVKWCVEPLREYLPKPEPDPLLEARNAVSEAVKETFSPYIASRSACMDDFISALRQRGYVVMKGEG